MTKTHKSEALASIHEMMESFHQGGHIDKRTMREFDEACLAPDPCLESAFSTSGERRA